MDEMEDKKNSKSKRDRLFDTKELSLEFWSAHVLQDAFNEAELQEIAYEMGWEWDSLGGENKRLKAISIAEQGRMEKRLKELLDLIMRKRPYLSYDDK